jgi:hypothetical protein
MAESDAWGRRASLDKAVPGGVGNRQIVFFGITLLALLAAITLSWNQPCSNRSRVHLPPPAGRTAQ